MVYFIIAIYYSFSNIYILTIIRLEFIYIFISIYKETTDFHTDVNEQDIVISISGKNLSNKN